MIKKIGFISLLIFAYNAYATEDPLSHAILKSINGTKVQATRMNIAAENLANESSTSNVAGGDPYKRKIIFVENKFNHKHKTNLIGVKKFSTDKSPFQLKYDPYNPAADARGYVKLPNVRREIEMADSSEAQRSYEANLTTLDTARSMINRTIEAIK